jgi:hypothetical protein
MSLVTKIKLTPNYDWKSILLEDITGTGITGYGGSQLPAGLRVLPSKTLIILTSPSGTVKNILTPGTNPITSSYIITNVDLDYNIDDTLEEGIWTVEYVNFFFNSDPTTLNATTPNTNLTYLIGNKDKFINATKLFRISDDTVSNIISNTITTLGTLVTNKIQTTLLYSQYLIGIGTTLYTSITKELKECLDNKIADESLCPCDCGDCSLMQKYLLYEAIELNCKQANYTKANQIFTYLTELSTNCGC